MAVGMWWYGAILVGLGIITAVGYRVMIDVKPKVGRPSADEVVGAEIQELERRLMEHVRVLGGTIGERNLHRPLALRAAADYIRQAWKSQGSEVAEERVDVLG